MSRPARALLAASALLALSACAADGTSGPAASAPVAAGPGREAERHAAYLEAVAQARRFEAAGRPRDALLRWRAAVAVAPSDAVAVREEARLRGLVTSRARALVEQGDAARRTGSATAARAAYEQALELQPDAPGAVDGLKQIESAATLQSIATGGAGGPGMSGAAHAKGRAGKGKTAKAGASKAKGKSKPQS